jgi:hypothetical protein
MANLFHEQRLVGRQVRHDAPQAPHVLILDRVLAMFQAGLPAGEKLVTPLRELRGRHPVAAAEALE